MKTQLFFISILACMSINLSAQKKSTDFEKLENEITDFVSSDQAKSISISISKKGNTIFSKAYGEAKPNQPATGNISYQIASVTKPFTATGIMILAERNEIDLEKPFTTYLPEYKIQKADSTYQTPTIRQLLSHTGGLGTFFYVAPTPEKQVKIEDSWKSFGVQFEKPGTVYEYSNLGYGLLSEIIEEVSGISYAEFMDKEIFEPLGMNHSFVMDTDKIYTNKVSKSLQGSFIEGELYNNTEGAGNIYSTTEDLLKFGNFHLNLLKKTPMISKDKINEMHSFKKDEVLYHYYKDVFYGLGWYFGKDIENNEIFWHEGGTPGASAMLFMVPNQEIVVAVTSNTFNAAIMQQIAQTALSLYGVELNQGIFNPLANYKDIDKDSGLVGEWKGSFVVEENEIPVTLTINEKEVYFEYLDYSVISNNMPQPFFIKTAMMFTVINEKRFMGMVIGNLPKEAVPESRNLFNLKFIKYGDTLKGFITALPLGGDVHYAFPYQLELEKIAQ